MTGYIDSSVLLRIILKEPGKISKIHKFSELISSELIRVECMRVLYRYRLLSMLNDEELSSNILLTNQLLEEISIIPITQLIIQRAALPTPTILGTLDAIHFVTAQLWKEKMNKDLIFLTHDEQLQKAANSINVKYEG